MRSTQKIHRRRKKNSNRFQKPINYVVENIYNLLVQVDHRIVYRRPTFLVQLNINNDNHKKEMAPIGQADKNNVEFQLQWNK